MAAMEEGIMSEHPSPADALRPGELSPMQRLEVRRCTVITGAGPVEAHASVFCLRRERSVPVAICGLCETSAGIQADAAGRPDQVICNDARPAGEGAARRPPPGRDDELVAKLSLPISAIMTREALCVRSDMRLEELRQALLERGHGGLPVVDAVGRPVGMVTKTDLLRAEGREDWHRAEHAERAERQASAGLRAAIAAEPGTVGAIMTDLALAVHESMSVAQAAALMAYEGVHRLPVVDDDQRVVGVLSSLDVLHWIGERAGYLMRAVAPHRPEPE